MHCRRQLDAALGATAVVVAALRREARPSVAAR
jgi:hypothetical protein